MTRKAIYILLVSLALGVWAPRSEADLGCISPEPGFGPIATCDADADCLSVGSDECSGGLCFCPGDPFDDFCACGSTMAPALSRGGQFAVVGLLSMVGLLGLWRRRAGRQSQLA